MTLILSILLAVGMAVYVGFPLVKRQSRPTVTPALTDTTDKEFEDTDSVVAPSVGSVSQIRNLPPGKYLCPECGAACYGEDRLCKECGWQVPRRHKK